MQFKYEEEAVEALSEELMAVLNSFDGETAIKAFATLLVLKSLGVALNRAEGVKEFPLAEVKRQQLTSPSLGNQCIIAAESVGIFLMAVLGHEETGVVPTPEQLFGELYGIQREQRSNAAPEGAA